MSNRDEDQTLDELAALYREEEDAMDTAADPFGPLTGAEQQALTDGVFARLGLEAPVEGEDEADASDASKDGDGPRGGGQVISLRSRWSRVAVTAGTLTAVAAATLLVVLRPGLDLPEYAVIAPSADAAHRGEPVAETEEVPHYTLGRSLEFVLRPARRVDEDSAAQLTARVFVDDGASLTLVAADVEPAEGGSLVVRVPTGPGSAVDLPGAARFVFLVGDSAELGALAEGVHPRASLPDGRVRQVDVMLLAR